MKKSDCIFCKIATGESPSYRIREDEQFMAFFDLFPNCKGQTLVIPKEHYGSELFVLEDSDFYAQYLLAVQEVANLLKEKLGVQRVGMIVEGLGVNHLHAKLYPMRGLDAEWKPVESDEKVYFETYPGYMTTKMGEMADQEELEKLQSLFIR